MAIQYSIQKMVSDGTLSTIALGIQYLQRNDIYMRVAGEETPQSGAPSGYTWSFIDNTTLKILPVVSNGVEVVVYRRTDVDAMYNIYSQNAQFDEATIDENNQQLLYIAQEYLEQGLPGTGVDTIEYVRDDGSFTYYRMRRTDGSYSEEFTVPSASNSTKVLTRESLRRSYAEAGYNLVDGSFETGGTLVNANDVLLHEASGKAFSGPAGVIAAGTDPASGGFVDVSGKINPVVLSVAELKATNAVVGCLYRTKGYYAAGDGGGAEYVAMPSGAASPDGYGDHLAANGVVLQLVSQPTDLNHGIKLGSFVAAGAWSNRNALQAMLRNTRWSYFELVASGTYYVLGSVHPLRDNITILHRKGCNIRGRYNDPSIPASLTSQGGHMFGFVDYADPDNGNFTIGNYFDGIDYIIEGDIASEYNAGHSALHNNNCLGFYKTKNCSVRGYGGVSGSDHRGVNFDGGAINCHVDIGYSKGTMDEPVVMKASAAVGNLCTVKIGRVDETPFGGSVAPIVVRCENGNVKVRIGSFTWDGVTKPQLVGCFVAGTVDISFGDVDGVSQLARQLDTANVSVTGNSVKNTPYGIVRAGSALGAMKSASITGIKSVDSSFVAAYRAETNQDTFATLEIANNNFSGAGTSFAFYNNRTPPGLPSRYDLHDNPTPSGFTPVDFNRLTSGITGNLVTPGSTSLVVNFKSPDWVYGKMSAILQVGGVNHSVEIDLRTRDLTSTQVNYYAGTGTLATTKSGGSLTLTCTGCTLQIVTMHN